MGANCCVAAKEKTLPERIGDRVVIQRNARYSPSWSFHWDNRTHIEDVMDNPSHSSYYNSGNVGSELKNAPDIESEGFSDGGSHLDGHVDAKWRKLSLAAGASRVSVGDISSESISSQEKYSSASPSRGHALDYKASISFHSTQSPTLGADPLSSSSSLPSVATSSLEGHCSPNDEFALQVSDRRVQGLMKPPQTRNSSLVEWKSSVLSLNKDLSSGGFQEEFSDGWSRRAFSELVASSQGERCSVDSENQSSMSCKMTVGSNTQLTAPVPYDIQTCGLCSKLLKERSSWSSHKIVARNVAAVSAVLACRHVYHAECLEAITLECDRFDPSCPVCDNRGAELKIENKHASMDAAAVISERRKRGKFLRIGLSSVSRPFLRRYFSIGPSKPRRSLSVSESSSRSKGFWVRHRRGE